MKNILFLLLLSPLSLFAQRDFDYTIYTTKANRVEAAIKAKPSDIQSKIECADIIENWVANYLKS